LKFLHRRDGQWRGGKFSPGGARTEKKYVQRGGGGGGPLRETKEFISRPASSFTKKRSEGDRDWGESSIRKQEVRETWFRERAEREGEVLPSEVSIDVRADSEKSIIVEKGYVITVGANAHRWAKTPGGKRGDSGERGCGSEKGGKGEETASDGLRLSKNQLLHGSREVAKGG